MEAGGEASSERIVLYIHGNGCSLDLWYRVEIEPKRDDDKFVFRSKCEIKVGEDRSLVFEDTMTRRPRPRPRKDIYHVARLCADTCGSWVVIGDDIYCIGKGNPLLLKHNVADPVDHWVLKSSSINIPSGTPSLDALGTEKQQLCVAHHCSDGDDSECWSTCCGIYDPDEKTWNNPLPFTFKHPNLDAPTTFIQANLVERDVPTQLVFYSLDVGSMIFLDVTSGTSYGPVIHNNFALLQHSKGPKPLPGLPPRDVCFLLHAVKEPAVFSNNTFYWFSPDLRLYGYDINAERWFQSPSLLDQLPYLAFCLCAPYILVGLGNGRFLVIVAMRPGVFAVASLMADKGDNSLIVSADSVQPFSLDDDSFLPIDGKAILKQVIKKISIQPSPLVQAPNAPMLESEAFTSKEIDGGSQTEFSVLDTQELLVEDYEEFIRCKSNFPLDLGSSEVICSAKDDTVAASEVSQSFVDTGRPDESISSVDLDVSGDRVDGEKVVLSAEGKTHSTGLASAPITFQWGVSSTPNADGLKELDGSSKNSLPSGTPAKGITKADDPVIERTETTKVDDPGIAKVTNWSTGKPHSSLKSLLAKSLLGKLAPSAANKDETASIKNGVAVTTVNMFGSSEAPVEQGATKEGENKCNRSAKYPGYLKKEKWKTLWVPLVCCSSAH